MEKENPTRMNADMLSRLFKMLTSDSPLGRLALLSPERGPITQGDRKQHRRAGVTTNKGRGETKARRKMAKESRRRNRR